jgi:hypothetical protein
VEDLCNQLLKYGTHGEQAAMRQIYDSGISQRKSFREIYAEMNELTKSYERLLPTASAAFARRYSGGVRRRRNFKPLR